MNHIVLLLQVGISLNTDFFSYDSINTNGKSRNSDSTSRPILDLLMEFCLHRIIWQQRMIRHKLDPSIRCSKWNAVTAPGRIRTRSPTIKDTVKINHGPTRTSLKFRAYSITVRLDRKVLDLSLLTSHCTTSNNYDVPKALYTQSYTDWQIRIIGTREL